MSEATPAVGRDEVWIEKYRPRTLDEVVGQEAITSRLAGYVEQDDLPHLLFSGPAGVGKSSAATSIAQELYGDDWESNFLELNASDERGIDVVRERIKNFARSSFGGFDYRIIFLDEADSMCVPPGSKVVTGHPSKPEVKPIEDVAEHGEPVLSVDFETNNIQSDRGSLVDSGIADFFEVELDDGREIVASLSHPFFVVGSDGRLVERELQDLKPGDEIADIKDDIGLSRCEICGAWIPGRVCSIDCENDGNCRDMQGEGDPMEGFARSEERREKIVQKLSDGRFIGQNNPDYGGEIPGLQAVETEAETIERFRQTTCERRSASAWAEWTVEADPGEMKPKIERSSAIWWASRGEGEEDAIRGKMVETTDYPVSDITGDNNPRRDPEDAAKGSEAPRGQKPMGGATTGSDERVGHHVRSDREREVAKALRDAGIEYEYEPEFQLSDAVFRPDFLVGEAVIEGKGVATLWEQTEKGEEFLEIPGDDYRYVVVGDRELHLHEHHDPEGYDPALVFGGGRRSVSTVAVRSIKYSHRGKAYNITMEGTPNFILANGILTHNTSDAQSALRRTMEQFSHNTRFILSVNYSSKVIDPIQSRCAVFRFSALPDGAVDDRIREIAELEGIELADDGVEALVYAADGDMRKAINALQAAAVLGETVDEEAVFTITSTAKPEDIERMVEATLAGDFSGARAVLDELLTEQGLAGGDVIDQLHRSVWDFDIDDEAAVRLLDRVGEADYRIAEGANERLQLEALLAAVALGADEEE